MKETKSIGECGVDSGQILIVDPQLFTTHWEKEKFNVSRRFLHTKTGVEINEGEHFRSFQDDIIPQFNKNMNTMLAEGDVEQLPYLPATCILSYYACCVETLESPGFGVLRDGVAGVTRTGLGDGCYDVFPIEDSEGNRKGVQIVFLKEFDLTDCLSEDMTGEVTCKSGVLMLIDPCYAQSQQNLNAGGVAYSLQETLRDGSVQLNYDMGHSGLGVMIKLEEGDYDMHVQVADVEGWGERVLGVALVKKPV